MAEGKVSEDRLVDIETQLAFQEDTLLALNQVLCRQQEQIELLERSYRQLLSRVEDLRGLGKDKEGSGVAEERPPHY